MPALTDPDFISADKADTWLLPMDRILGVIYQGQVKAYPLAIMNWHEIVNDKIGSRVIV